MAVTQEQRHGSDGEAAALAESFASFVKACFVYPENNVRVREAGERALQAIGRGSVTGESPVLKLGGRHVVCLDAVLETPLPPTVEWLKRTFRGAALAGVEFGQELRMDELLRFARRLRENFRKGRRHPSFDALWSEGVRGFRLIEPRFRGRFAADDDDSDTADFPDSPATQAVRFARSVDHHPGIAEKLKALQRVLAEHDAAQTQETDVVAHIVHLLPEDVRNNPVALIKTVESILTLAADQLVARRERNPHDLDFRRLLLRICQTFFVRQDEEKPAQTAAPEAEDGPQGHAGDELVTDDLDALLRELEPIPDQSGRIPLQESPAEQLGVCVHQLLSSHDDDHLLNLKPRLAALLADPGPDELRIVRECIAAGSGDGARTERLVAFLADANLTAVLRSTLVLPRDSLVADFPQNFCLFVDTLDAGDPEAARQLAELAAQIGRERILHRTAALLKDGLLSESRVRKLLAEPEPALLPFAEIVVQHGSRAQKAHVAQFLRRLDSSLPAAVALTIDEGDLPASFLLSLCQAAHDPAAAAGLNKTAANLLKQFIGARTTDPTEVQRRVYAVHSLRRLWSDDVAAFLKDVARRGPFSPIRVAKPVRVAARQLLRQQPNR